MQKNNIIFYVSLCYYNKKGGIKLENEIQRKLINIGIGLLIQYFLSVIFSLDRFETLLVFAGYISIEFILLLLILLRYEKFE